MSAKSYALMLDEAYARLMELDAEFHKQDRQRLMIDPELTKRRKEAGKVFSAHVSNYEALVGIRFAWPIDAVNHARATFLDGAA